MSMLMRMPKYIPPLDEVLYDLFNPKPEELARVLDVDKSTVRRWIAQNKAPRPVMLALFWMTRWGMQWMDADLYNEAQVHFAMNSCQARRIRELEGKLNRVLRIGNFGSANDPAEGVPLPLPSDMKVVYLHRRRSVVQGTPAGKHVEALPQPALILERRCRPPNGYRHFVTRKRGAA